MHLQPCLLDWASVVLDDDSPYDVVMIGTAAHVRPLQHYIHEVSAATAVLRKLRERRPHSTTIVRTASPGLEHCWDYASEPVSPAARGYLTHQLLHGSVDNAFGPRRMHALNAALKQVCPVASLSCSAERVAPWTP